MYKNTSGTGILLEEFFANKGIDVKSDAANMTATSISYRFKEEKDYFLFRLKF